MIWTPRLLDPMILNHSESPPEPEVVPALDVSNPAPSPVSEADARTQGYKDRAEYRSLAHTLRITPVGAVRSATQNRLIEILEALGK